MRYVRCRTPKEDRLYAAPVGTTTVRLGECPKLAGTYNVPSPPVALQLVARRSRVYATARTGAIASAKKETLPSEAL